MTESDKKLLEMHAEAKAHRMFLAYDSMMTLDRKEFRAVQSAVKAGSTKSMTDLISTYREELTMIFEAEELTMSFEATEARKAKEGVK